MKNKFMYVGTYLIAMNVILLAVYERSVFIYSLIAITFLFSLSNTTFSYVSWIIAYPYFRYFTNITNKAGYFVLVPLLLIGVSLNLVRRLSKYKVSKDRVVFYLAFIILTIFSFILGKSDYQRLSALLLQLFTMVVFFSFANLENKEELGYILYAYVVSSISILIVNIWTGNFIDSGRLDIGESIRRVSNVTTPAITVVYLEILNIRRNNKQSLINYKFGFWTLLLILSILVTVLLGTVSRGSYVAVLITIILTELLYQITARKTTKSIAKNFSFTALVTVLFIYFYKITTDYISGAYMTRVTASAFATDLRWEIWRAGISQMTIKDYIIGSGPNTFTNLATAGGLNFYAHSVIIDTFVTLGLAGLLVMSCVYIKTFHKIIITKNLWAFSFLVMTILLYSTHGNIGSSLDFWTLLGITVFLVSSDGNKAY